MCKCPLRHSEKGCGSGCQHHSYWILLGRIRDVFRGSAPDPAFSWRSDPDTAFFKVKSGSTPPGSATLAVREENSSYDGLLGHKHGNPFLHKREGKKLFLNIHKIGNVTVTASILNFIWFWMSVIRKIVWYLSRFLKLWLLLFFIFYY